MQGEPRLCITQTPTVTLSTIGYRLSAIGYRLSAIGYDQPSAMECKARPRGLYRIMYSKTIIAWFPGGSSATAVARGGGAPVSIKSLA